MKRTDDASRSLLEERISRRGVLWGREQQTSKLELLSSQISGGGGTRNNNQHDNKGEGEKRSRCACQIALVHGPSGSGKTQLCKEIARKRDKSTQFLFGKVDQYNDNSSPYSALVQAFESLLEDDGDRESDKNDEAKHEEDSRLFEAVHESLAAEARVLGTLCPALRKRAEKHCSQSLSISEDSSSEEDIEVDEDCGTMKMVMGSERLALAVVSFLRSICRPEHPVIIALDDLQWADQDTLNVLKTIGMHSATIENLLVLGIYRDDPDLPTEKLDSLVLKMKQHADIHDISFPNLSAKQVSEFVSEILGLEHEQDKRSQSISQFVHLVQKRTQGNPHFLLEFLYMLHRHRLLVFDWVTNRWEWDIASIQANTKITENVVVVLTQKVQQLPSRVLRLLQVAAALGYAFHLHLLEEVFEKIYDDCSETAEVIATMFGSSTVGEESKDEEKLSFSEMIDLASTESIIERSSLAHGTYHFCHDKLQEAIYGLLPASKARDMMHWFAGMFIRKQMTENSRKTRSKYLFLAADQLNRGSSCISSESERLAVIELNCEAARAAKQRNGVDLAGSFLRHAMHLIRPERDWRSSYDLTLKVLNSLVDYEAAANNTEKCLEHVDAILSHAKQQEDCIVALASRARIHMTRAEHATSIAYCRKALKLCGEPIPRFVNFLAVLRELWQAKQLAKGKTDEDLLNLPEMMDPQKRNALKVLMTLAINGWQLNPNLLSLSCIRFFNISLAHGRSRYLGTALAAMGSAMAEINENDKAIQLAKLALKAEERHGAAEPTTLLMAYVSCLHLEMPVTSITESFLLGYRRGLGNGDTFFGGACLAEYAMAYLDSGLRLQSLAADLERWTFQLKVLKRDIFVAFIVPVLLLAWNLIGGDTDITWRNVSTFFSDASAVEDSHKIKLNLLYIQLYNGYIFRSVEEVEESLRQMRKLPRGDRQLEETHYHNSFIKLLDGLAGFWLFARTRRQKHYRQAVKAIKWLKNHQNLNTTPLRMLLEAQRESLVQPVDVAKVKGMFDDALLIVRRSGLSHLGAIGLEAQGDFFHLLGDHPAALGCYSQAAGLYREWGALKKVEQLSETNGLKLHDIKEEGTILRGQERYTIRDAATLSIKDFIQ